MATKIVTSGKRKTSVARAVLTDNKNGLLVLVNGRDHHNLLLFDKLKIDEPVRIAEQIVGKDKLNFVVNISVLGGGEKGQIDACRLALARALVKVAGNKSSELEDAYFDYDRSLLVADVRRKETRKPGDSKARAKRQTSYR
ncbi:30S ribosomal protein S9 [Candidatus Pacearchaeota archaeon CG10_big_fil_rev_8_21_14_0_10_32_14]|nr:MAG: 30S ribosomal protein S9 [Candidatus Pacearchaeota archaeon CG10_big_fil_rev_8_21_14_0_10_32_14]